MSRELILALNPRMQFTRIAVYRMNSPVFLKKINHKPEEIGDFKCFCDQTKFRAKVIMDELKANDISIDEIKVIIQDVKDKVSECEKFAEESPYPEISQLHDMVYEQEDYPFIK